MERLPLPGRFVRRLGYPRVAHLPVEKQEGMRSFWLDGLFASMAGGFADPYYTLYILSLGASNAQIGLVSTLNQMMGALLSMPGAIIADRTGRYKGMTVITGLIARLLWLVMLAAPFLLPDKGAVWMVVIGWVGISAFGTLGSAAWTALSADLVPPQLRGAYFASRNIIIQGVRLLAIPIAGQIIAVIGEPRGYQIGLGLAFLFGMVSLYYYNRLPEHRPTRHEERLTLREAIANARHMPTLVRFTASHAVLQFGVGIGGPFIAVYMAEGVGLSVGTIGFVTTANVLASVIGMRIMGRIHDRRGMTWTMRFGLAIPFIPSLWLFVTHPWQAFAVNSFAALAWAGYNLGAFNLLLASTPDDHRPRYIALHSTTIALAAALGPLLGGWLLDATGFTLVFGLSTAVRLLGLILFFVLVREPSPQSESIETVEAGRA